MNNYIISTERLGLRDWLEEDLEPFADMNMDKEVMKFFPAVLSKDETRQMVQRIRVSFEKNGFGLFAVEKAATGGFIGFTGFAKPGFESFFTPCIEIGWRFKREAWGMGFATEAARACLNYGFEILRFDKIASFTSTTNERSEKLMKRIGMTKIAEFDHPNIQPADILCRHVLYEISKESMPDKVC